VEGETRVFVAVGSNVGDRHGFITRAVDLLIRTPGVKLVGLSQLRRTAPAGMTAGAGDFLNGAVEIRTTMGPRDLLERLLDIEHELGRAEERPKNQDRTIDLDLVIFGGTVLAEADLVVPHPGLMRRAFVLEPLLDLDPDLLDPATGKRLADALREVRGASGGGGSAG
jgi:2-amino-4-hydroxy-6-hydroxymethyldihydropteridine diphosphokinase